MIVLSNRFAEARAAVAEARRLVAVGLDLVGRASASDLPAVAVAAKAVLACHPEGAVGPSPEGPAIATADRAAAREGSVPQLVTSLDQLRNAASQELSRRQDTWRPHALALAEWLPNARKARKASESLQNLKAAVAPFWDQLRLQSDGERPLPESPFRFIVIDDPVQSMDLATVRRFLTKLIKNWTPPGG